VRPGDDTGVEAWGADLAGGVVEELDPWKSRLAGIKG
jgi:hypothetical protein